MLKGVLVIFFKFIHIRLGLVEWFSMHLSSVRSLSCWNALNFCSLFLQFLVLLLYSSSDMTVQYIKVVTNHDALLTALLDGLNTLTVL